MLFIALCSSSAHKLLDLLSVQVSVASSFASRPNIAGSVRRRQLCYARVTASERWVTSASTASGPGTRSARGNARRRRASSKHSKLGCRYAPRPGSLAWGSGMTWSPIATRRSRLDFAARSLQPTHVRTGAVPLLTICNCSDRTIIPTVSLPLRARCRLSRIPGIRRIRPDVDPPPGQPGCQPRVLPFLADDQGQLVVRDHDAGLAGIAVNHVNAGHPGWGQRVRDELCGVVGVVDDVDLLAVELGHHVPDPAANRADARALGVHALLVGLDGDLGAVPGLAGDLHDLHRAAGDLRHLQREQLAHQVRVRTRQRHRRAAVPLADSPDVAADALAVNVLLAGHLLGGWQHGLDLAEVDEHRARVLALLDHARDDVALVPRVLAEGHLVLDVPQPLQDHLARGRGRDPPEPRGRVVVLPLRRAVRPGLPRPDGHVAGLPVHLDTGSGAGPLDLLVRH